MHSFFALPGWRHGCKSLVTKFEWHLKLANKIKHPKDLLLVSWSSLKLSGNIKCKQIGRSKIERMVRQKVILRIAFIHKALNIKLLNVLLKYYRDQVFYLLNILQSVVGPSPKARAPNCQNDSIHFYMLNIAIFFWKM